MSLISLHRVLRYTSRP